MSDTPPSIPPRHRPASSGGGRGAEPAGGGRGSQDASGGASWSSAAGDGGATRSYTVDVSRGVPAAGRSTAPRTGERPTAEPRRTTAGVAPTGEERSPTEETSPLVNAVDATTGWLRKAAGVTSSGLSKAYAQLTRPRSEDAHMTTTPTTAGAATADRPAPRASGPVTGATPRPATGRIPTVGAGPRRVRLAISRVDPWSVMKLAFLLSVAIGIMIVVAAMVVWFTLDGLHVFTKADGLVRQVVGDESPLDILSYVSFEKTVSAATLVAVIDVFLLTALATIGAFLYNIVAALVGGVHVTMTDE